MKLFYYIIIGFTINTYFATLSNGQVNTISGLALWINADSVQLSTGAQISKCYDLSGNANDAIQSIAAQQPILTNSTLNGHKTMLFDGIDDVIKFNSIATIRTVFWVVKRNLPSYYCTLLGAGASLDFVGGANNQIWDQTYTSPFILNGQTNRNFNTINGVITSYPQQYGVLSLVTTDNVLAENFGSERGISGRFWDGELAELIIYNQALTTTQVNTIENYLNNKYAPPVKLPNDITIFNSFCDTVISPISNYSKYLWSTGDTTSFIKVSSSGKYWLTGTNQFDIISSDTINVTINRPMINVISRNKVCPNSTLLYNTQLSHNNYTFIWQDNSTDSLFTITQAGNYYVNVTDNYGCKYKSDTVNVVVDNFPIYASLGVDTALCVGNSIYLKTGAAQAVSYVWNTTATTPSIAITTAGQYAVQATNTNGCVANDTINVSLLGTAPVVNFTYSNNCKGNAVNFINTSVPPTGASITSNQWSINYNATTATTPNFNPIVNDTLTYLVTLSATASNGCANFTQKSVKVYNQPQINFTTLNSCSNAPTLFKALPTLRGNTFINYTWNSPFTGNFVSTSTTINETIVTSGNNTYSLTLNTTNGCSATVSKNVYTYKAPEVDFEITNNCENTTTRFKDITNYYGPYTVLNGKWSINGVDSSAQYLTNYESVLPKGNYTATLTVQASNGCIANKTIPFEVYDVTMSSYTFTNNCTDEFLVLNAANTTVTSTQWNINNTFYNGKTIRYNLNNSVIDSLAISLTTIDSNHCTTTLANKIYIQPHPQAMLTYTMPEQYSLPYTFKINNTSSNANSYQWFVNNDLVAVAGDSVLSITINNDQTSYIKLIASTNNQCVDMNEINVSFTKNIQDVMIDDVSYTTSTDNYIKPTCRLTNLGTRTLNKLMLTAQIAGNSPIKETWVGTLKTGEYTTYNFNALLEVNNLKHYNNALCAKVVLPVEIIDANLYNNSSCIALDSVASIALSAVQYSPSQAIITVISHENKTVNYTLLDNGGKVVATNNSVALQQGYNTITQPLAGLAQGAYTYVIIAEGIKLAGKLMLLR